MFGLFQLLNNSQKQVCKNKKSFFSKLKDYNEVICHLIIISNSTLKLLMPIKKKTKTKKKVPISNLVLYKCNNKISKYVHNKYIEK